MIPINQLTSLLLMALMIAITSFVYSYVLTRPGELFSGLFKFLDSKIFKNDKRYSEGKDMHPLFKPLIGCEKCVSGQMAAWFYLSFYYDVYLHDLALYFVSHIILIGTSIFFATIIKSFYTKNIE